MNDLLRKREPAPETTVDLLLECHERIRRFTRLAQELVTRADAKDEQLADAARSLCAYFGRAFQLHAQDEDISIRPRVEAAGSPRRGAARDQQPARSHARGARRPAPALEHDRGRARPPGRLPRQARAGDGGSSRS
ncbi:MAG: hemerythrin domain-containing protein [Sandaracinaceae bacterium]|nr:hemerythrin domain-containing protein [Sandaracinaceae bacterium]